jgi:hypothetical protein
MINKNTFRSLLFILIVSVLMACNRGYGCANDQYNSYGSKNTKKNTTDMNSNKTKKSKKPVSERMSPF